MEKIQQVFTLGTARLVANYAYEVVEEVQIPRQTVVKNIRLGATLRSLQVVALLFVISLIVTNTDYIKILEPNQAGLLAFWDDASESAYDAQDQADLTAPFCASPEVYDYVYSENWRYENYTCATPSQTSERVWKESDLGIFIPTSFQETHYQQLSPPSGGNCSDVLEPCASARGWVSKGGVCDCRASAMFFVTGVDALTLAFDHWYALEHYSKYIFTRGIVDYRSSQRSDASCDIADDSTCEVGSSTSESKELRTIIVVKTGSGDEALVGWYDAPQTLVLPLSSILAAGGLSLDGLAILTRNLIKCDTSANATDCRDDVQPFPLLRQTGLGINIDLQYSNHWVHPSVPCTECLVNHVGPLCKAVVTVKPKWTSRQGVDCAVPRDSSKGDATCTSRYYYGIKVTFKASGSFGIVDPNYVMVTLGAALVYLTIPLILVKWLAIYMLGALSNVYYKAGRDSVFLRKQLASFVSRMIISQSAYTSVTGGEGIPLTKDMILERIHQSVSALKDRGSRVADNLSFQEQIRLAELVMDAMDRHGEGAISVDEFVEASTCNEAMSFRDALLLFDHDRKPGWLERIFTPHSWRHSKKAPEIFEREDGVYHESRILENVNKARESLERRSPRSWSSEQDTLRAKTHAEDNRPDAVMQGSAALRWLDDMDSSERQELKR